MIGDTPIPPPPVSLGIVTALGHEFAAVQLVMPGKTVGAHHFATLKSGSGGYQRQIVVTLLPEMGTNQAAAATTELLLKFPLLEAVIMTGIAGGIPHPSKADEHVRLGDIVACSGQGMIQYDFIKRSGDTVEHRHPPRPPYSRLLAAAKRLQAGELTGKRPWQDIINVVTRSMPRFARPAAETDMLRDAVDSDSIAHPQDSNRILGEPRVFLGPIASSNTLLKDVRHRDHLREMFRAKAVEMEGSGVADAVWALAKPYYAVRGICDYCNATKGDAWQMYAALTAAAFTRTLIETLPPPDVLVPSSQPTDLPSHGSSAVRTLSTFRAPLTRFFGRSTELAQIAEALTRRDQRVVTVYGPGGSGKSRVCLEAASQCEPHFGGRVFTAELTGVDSPGQLIHMINSAAQSRGLDGSQTALLLLDNFEQLCTTDGIRSLVEYLESSPRLRCLISSRKRLNIAGEFPLSLPPLPLPSEAAPATEAADAPAVQMLLDRLSERRPEVDWRTGHSIKCIARLCRIVDGLPLAIEMVAARFSRYASADAVLDALKFLDLKHATPGLAPANHNTMRAVLDWSYNLLEDEDERLVLQRLSVFAGSFSIASASAVCAWDGDTVQDIHDVLESLSRQGWLPPFDSTSRDTPIRLLECVREYAAEQLGNDSERYARLHRGFFEGYARRGWPRGQPGRIEDDLLHCVRNTDVVAVRFEDEEPQRARLLAGDRMVATAQVLLGLIGEAQKTPGRISQKDLSFVRNMLSSGKPEQAVAGNREAYSERAVASMTKGSASGGQPKPPLPPLASEYIERLKTLWARAVECAKAHRYEDLIQGARAVWQAVIETRPITSSHAERFEIREACRVLVGAGDASGVRQLIYRLFRPTSIEFVEQFGFLQTTVEWLETVITPYTLPHHQPSRDLRAALCLVGVIKRHTSFTPRIQESVTAILDGIPVAVAVGVRLSGTTSTVSAFYLSLDRRIACRYCKCLDQLGAMLEAKGRYRAASHCWKYANEIRANLYVQAEGVAAAASDYFVVERNPAADVRGEARSILMAAEAAGDAWHCANALMIVVRALRRYNNLAPHTGTASPIQAPRSAGVMTTRQVAETFRELQQITAAQQDALQMTVLLLVGFLDREARTSARIASDPWLQQERTNALVASVMIRDDVREVHLCRGRRLTRRQAVSVAQDALEGRFVEPWAAGYELMQSGVLWRIDDAFAEAIAALKETPGRRIELGVQLLNHGVICHIRGSSAQAKDRYEAAMSCLEGDVLHPWCLTNLGILLCESGQVHESEDRLLRAHSQAIDNGSHEAQAFAERSLGQLHVTTGRTTSARAYLAASLEKVNPEWTWTWQAFLWSARAESAAGRPATCMEYLNRAVEHLQTTQSSQAWALAEVLVSRAQAAMTAGNVSLALSDSLLADALARHSRPLNHANQVALSSLLGQLDAIAPSASLTAVLQRRNSDMAIQWELLL